MIRTLYVSQTGMSEALGQSQVLAYLEGLARRGVAIDLLSMEPTGTPPAAIEALRARMVGAGIDWTPLVRSSSSRLSRKVLESASGVVHALSTALRKRPHVVHARSYVATAVADVVATVSPGAKLLFDCRGMLGDEYVDAGYWTTDRLEYRLLKAFERRIFRRAEGVVVLTEALRAWLEERRVLPTTTAHAVVPCCVDTARFRFDANVRDEERRTLGIGERLALFYSGGLGGWYLEDEMARFAGHVKRIRADAVFVLATKASPTRLRGLLLAEGFAESEVLVDAVAPERMPRRLVAGDVGLCFIKPCFSKIGSSPTKVAEYLASGLAVAGNAGIGDMGDLTDERDACAILRDFSLDEMARAAHAAVALAQRSTADRARHGLRVAEARFGLETVGVARYERLYRQLCEV